MSVPIHIVFYACVKYSDARVAKHENLCGTRVIPLKKTFANVILNLTCKSESNWLLSKEEKIEDF